MPYLFPSDIFKRRELLSILVSRNLKIRYKNSALGFFWSLLTPGLMILMYAIFAHILKFNDGRENYLQFLVSGIIIWQFTAGCLNDSLSSIVGNSNLVKKVFFPRIILPLSTALANAVNFLFTFVVLLAYLILSKSANFHTAYWLLPAILMQVMLCIGVCCLCSTSNVFFRDTQHIVGIGSLAWFFLSPIFYSIDMQIRAIHFSNPQLAGIVFLNPMSGILASYRAGLMGLPITPVMTLIDGSVVSLNPCWIVLSAVVCCAVMFAGFASIRSGDKYFGDIL